MRALRWQSALTYPIASQWVPFLSRFAGEDKERDRCEMHGPMTSLIAKSGTEENPWPI